MSKSMEAALESALNDRFFPHAHQLLLPESVQPRLDPLKPPLLKLNTIFPRVGPAILHATDHNAAKLLIAPMRDARNFGPAFREANRNVGWYLATEFISNMIGLEEYEMDHIQGNKTSGYRFRAMRKKPRLWH